MRTPMTYTATSNCPSFGMQSQSSKHGGNNKHRRSERRQMERLTEQQVTLAMLEITQKEAQLLTIQTVDIVQALQQSRFQQALKQYEPLLERVRFLGGMLLRVANTTGRLT